MNENCLEFIKTVKEVVSDNIDDLCESCRENFCWGNNLDKELEILYYDAFLDGKNHGVKK